MENKPLIIAIEECKNEIIKNITDSANKNGLSYYLLETILKDIYEEVRIKKQSELQTVYNNYNETLKKEGENNAKD